MTKYSTKITNHEQINLPHNGGLQELINQLEENGGEATPEQEQALAISEAELESKLYNYAYAIRKYENEAETAKQEEKRIADIRKSKENIAAKLKQVVTKAMLHFDKPKIGFDTIQLSLRKSEGLMFTDQAKVPDEYKSEKIVEVTTTPRLRQTCKKGLKLMGLILKHAKTCK